MAKVINNFIDVLGKQKSISEKEIVSLKKDFEGRSIDAIVEFLLDQGMVPKNEILSALSKYYNVPSFDCAGYMFDHNLVGSFDEDFLRANAVIPVNQSDDILVVVASNPDHPDLDQLIIENTDAEVAFYVGIKRDILDAVQEFSQEPVTEDDVEFEDDEFNEDDYNITDDLE